MDTREAIKAQFMEEYARKDFQQITVKGLCAATPVARTTFYSYYNNTDEVKAAVEDDLMNELLAVADKVSEGNLPDMDFFAFLTALEGFFKQRWSDFYAFLVLQPNQRFIERWKNSMKTNFRRRYPNKQNIRNYELITEMIASACLGAYTYWMRFPDRVNVEDIKKLIGKTLDAVVPLL